MSRLQKLREILKQRNLVAYIVPTADPHQSEYVSKYHSRREYLTGFTGSAGTGIVFAVDQLPGVVEDRVLPGAFLWTDGRYDLQGRQELNLDEWNLMIYPNPEPHYPEWFEKHGSKIIESIRKNTHMDTFRIGVDPDLITLKEHRELSKKLEKTGFSLELVKGNLVDLIWDQDQEKKRPSIPDEKVFVLSEMYSGQPVSSKLEALRSKMKSNNCQYVVTTMLDEIAWIFNLRGSDISYNPVFLSYAVIGESSATLYVTKKNPLDSSVVEHLEKEKVQVKPYASFIEELGNLKNSGKVWISPDTTNMSIFSTLTEGVDLKNGKADTIYEADSEIERLKSLKNDTEIEGFRRANIRDGAAVCQFFAWLEKELKNGNTNISEVDAGNKLLEFRKKQPLFISESFAPIVGYASNGAIVHYKAKEGSCKNIGTEGILLVDSGAQYWDGTTDTTRTVHFGEPTDEERDAYTRVLKGHIALDRFVFPHGVGGFQLDVIARQFLWQNGMDYGHGTGHGIGHFLNVHEGPISIGYRNKVKGMIPLEKGIVCSNEPGYYATGKFGIRIENDVAVQLAKTDYRVNNVNYYRFETLTMVPIQTKLIDRGMLTHEEVKWINNYNQTVLDRVGPLLADDPETLEWLKKECKAI